MFAFILSSCTGGAFISKRLPLYVCFFVLLLNAFTSLHPSTFAVANALEEEEYSVSSLVLAFKNLKFWSIYRPAEEPKPIEETEPTQYEVNDDKEMPPEEAESLPTQNSNTFSQLMTNSETLPPASLENLWTERPKVPNALHFSKKMTTSKDNRICHSCSKGELFVDEDDEYRQRIEFIKEQILTRLGMKRPPNLHSQPDIDFGMCKCSPLFLSVPTNTDFICRYAYCREHTWPARSDRRWSAVSNARFGHSWRSW